MTTMDSTTLMTTQDLLAMPDDGIDRELSRGRLREFPMTRRGRRHTKTGSNIAALLKIWLKTQPLPRGEVLTGEAGFQLQHDPDTTVGIDVAYISPATATSAPEDAYIIDDIPLLAVEILSPSDSQEGIYEKVQDYIDAKVPIVWLVEPVFKTVTVYRPGKPPEMFVVGQEITAKPQLPGFKAPVIEIFE
jgi:Uma2 family endonuclease